MYNEKLNSYKDVPIDEQRRPCTDIICTIISSIFALTLFILAFCFMNKDHYYKSNFPTDSDHIPCSYGQNQRYPFVYFPDITKINQRVCVRTCPQKNDLQLSCRPNSVVKSCLQVSIYQTTPNFQRLGGFCAPTNQNQQKQLIKNANLSQKWTFLNTYDIIRLSILMALAVGILWMVLVQGIPRLMSMGAIILSILILIGSGVTLLVDNPYGISTVAKIIIACVLILLGLCFCCFPCLYRKRIKVNGILLDWATQFLSNQPANFLYIILFIALTAGLISLISFQYLAFLSHYNPQASQNDVYLKLKSSTVLQLLTIIEFIWGLQFLKDAFNFIISGNTAQWQTRNDSNDSCCIPTSRLIRRHWGSIAGGSFLNAFFNIIDFFFELIRCYPDGCCAVCQPCCSGIWKYCCCIFDLVRTDSYSYINLTGVDYCSASVECRNLYDSSNLFIGNQSVTFFYRTCAYISCTGIVTILCYILMRLRIDGINTTTLIIIIVLAYCVVSYFIDIHADSAEALQICYLLEQKLGDPSYTKKQNKYKNQLRQIQRERQTEPI